MQNLQIEGRRVRLRAVCKDDLPAIRRWYPDALNAQLASCTVVITHSGMDQLIGVLGYRMGEPAERWVTIGCVVLEEGARRRGLGVDAVLLFEEAAGEHGVGHLRADVDRENGLALYFWLRLGYRPSLADGEQDRGQISVIREIAAP